MCPACTAPAIQSYRLDGDQDRWLAGQRLPGIDGDSPITDLVTGFKPVLMQRTNVNGQTMLAPYNLIAWFWVYEDASGNIRPVRHLISKSAFLENGVYRPEIVAAFDRNGDGHVAENELSINSEIRAERERHFQRRDRLPGREAQLPA